MEWALRKGASKQTDANRRCDNVSRADAEIRRNRTMAGMITMGAPVMAAETKKCNRNMLEKGSTSPNNFMPCSRTKSAPNGHDSGKKTYLRTKKHLRAVRIRFLSELCGEHSDAG